MLGYFRRCARKRLCLRSWRTVDSNSFINGPSECNKGLYIPGIISNFLGVHQSMINVCMFQKLQISILLIGHEHVLKADTYTCIDQQSPRITLLFWHKNVIKEFSPYKYYLWKESLNNDGHLNWNNLQKNRKYNRKG